MLETMLDALFQVFYAFSSKQTWIEKALTLSSLSTLKSVQVSIKRFCDFTDAMYSALRKASLCPDHIDVTINFHYRCTDELVGAVGMQTVQYLNKFRALSSPEDIATWREFCKGHPSEKLRSMFVTENASATSYCMARQTGMPTRSAIHGYCQVSTSTSHGCPMTFGIEPLITQTL
jgi:hypothetical protein